MKRYLFAVAALGSVLALSACADAERESYCANAKEGVTLAEQAIAAYQLARPDEELPAVLTENLVTAKAVLPVFCPAPAPAE